MKITVTEAPGAVSIAMAGDDNSPQSVEELKAILEKALQQPPPITVTLNITELYYLGSEGVGVIAAAHRVAKEKGSEIVIVNPTKQVARVFMVTRLESFLNIKRDQ